MDVANLGHKDGIPSSLSQCGDWLFFSFLSWNVQNSFKTHSRFNFFFYCLVLTFCDVIGDLLPKWACLTLILPDNKFGGLIESNTTLREGLGNPIRVSKICNPRRSLPSRGCRKSWTRGWDSRVLPSMWCLIIFLILVQKCAKYV